MLYLPGPKLLFIHVPRTGGTALYQAVLGLDFFDDADRMLFQRRTKWVETDHGDKHKMGLHATADELQAVLGQKRWRRLTKFAVVRNPYDRTLSLWRAAQIGPNNRTGIPAHPDLGFEEFVTDGLYHGNADPIATLSQWAFLQRRRMLGVDRLFRFEDGLKDLQLFLEHRLDRKLTWERVWSFQRPGDAALYTPTLRAKVLSVFIDDFKHFYPDVFK